MPIAGFEIAGLPWLGSVAMAMISRISALSAAGIVGILVQFLPAQAQQRMFVHRDDVLRRTCPSTQCGVVGQFFRGERVPVFENVNGWSRVSRYYSAGCTDGNSAYVERGPSTCNAANGIVQGEFSEWVRSDALALEKDAGSGSDTSEGMRRPTG